MIPFSGWPSDLQDQYWERVAIMIFDGGMSEADAERIALADTWAQRDRAHRVAGPRLAL